MVSPRHPHKQPDDYQRLRDVAKLRALQLREEAIRDAPAWLARAVARAFQQLARRIRPQSVPSCLFPNQS